MTVANSNYRTFLMALVLTMTGLLGSAANAQDSAEAPPGGGFWTSISGNLVLTEVVPIRGGHPEEIAELLHHLFSSDVDDDRFDVSVIDSTRSLVIRCTPDKMKNVRAALERIDQPAIKGTLTETAIIECKHRRAQELAEGAAVQLSNLGKLAIDDARNTLVVRDRASNVEAVRDLVAALDQPTAKMIVEFHVLGHEGAAGGFGADLQAQIDELGLTGYGIVSHTMVRTTEGEKFAISESNNYRELSIRGKVKSNDRDNEASLEFSLDIEQRDEDESSKVRLQTTLRVPLGDRSIVGIAPTGEDGSLPLVLVVRVRSS